MKPLVREPGPSSSPLWQRPAPGAANGSHPINGEHLLQQVQREQLANELRSFVFGELKVRNPVWDMLLALFAAKHANVQLSMSDLCSMCDAPESTALRMIHQLRDKGYADMIRDRADKRRTRVILTDKAETQFSAYFNRTEAD